MGYNATTPYEMPFKSITGMPKVSFKGKQYTFAKFDTDGTLIPAVDKDGTIVVGVIQDPNEPNQPTNIMVSGISFAIVGATDITAGIAVVSDANGKVRAVAAGETSCGITVVGAKAGQKCCILLNR